MSELDLTAPRAMHVFVDTSKVTDTFTVLDVYDDLTDRVVLRLHLNDDQVHALRTALLPERRRLRIGTLPGRVERERQ